MRTPNLIKSTTVSRFMYFVRHPTPYKMKIVLGLVTLLASLELCIAFAFQTRYANPQSSRISTRLEASKSKPWASIAAAGLLTISLWGADASLANAGGSRVLGEISGSGLVFKDKLIVESFDDPKIQGVTLYLTSFERPLTERLSKDFFSDPSASSLTCSKSQDKVLVSDNVVATKEGEVSKPSNRIKNNQVN